MESFKELFTESNDYDENFVYWDKDKSRWGIDSIVRKEAKSWGEIEAVFVTAQNARDERFAERWCVPLARNEKQKAKTLNPGSGYIVCRYITLRSANAGMAPLCAVNPSIGKVKFLQDYDTELEDSKWDRPLKVQYLRVTPKFKD